LLYSVIGNGAEYVATCTPGYYNNEMSVPDEKAAKGLVYAGSLLDYHAHLDEFRAAGDFPSRARRQPRPGDSAGGSICCNRTVMESRQIIRTTHKVLAALEALNQHQALRVSEMSRLLDLPRTTTVRVLDRFAAAVRRRRALG
jgi:hypothetical protein